MLGHDADRVWQTLTEPVQIVRWIGRRLTVWLPEHPWNLPGPGRMDLEPEGVVVVPYCAVGEYGPMFICNLTTGTVTEVSPRRLLEYVIPGPDGPTAATRWELEETKAGTTLFLTYRFQARDRAPLVLADWHCRLDPIESILDGRDPSTVWEDYENYAATYTP